MTRKYLAAALAAATIASAVGCKGGGKEKKSPAAPPPVEGLAAIPASTDVLLFADVGLLSTSGLVDRAITRMFLADPGLKKELDQLFGGCGIKPARDLRSLLLAMDTDSGGRLLVVSGQLTEASITECVGQHLATVGGRLSQEPVDGRPHYFADAPEGKADVWFAFGDKKTLVVASLPSLLADALGKGPRLADEPQLADLLASARQPDAALWAAGRVPEAVGAGLVKASGGSLKPPVAMYGTLSLTDGVSATLGVVMASEDDATSSVSLVKTQLGVLGQIAQKHRLGRLVGKIAASSSADRLQLSLVATREELAGLIEPIDTEAEDDQTTAPSEQKKEQGVDPHGQGDPTTGGQAPL